SWFCYLLKKG
ncbi:type III secretion apparatus protein, YscD/HrpQ family, partial [Chlamydia psittaci 84-8471/1]